RVAPRGVPGPQRRSDLPGQHEQREVPRDHLPGDADRPWLTTIAAEAGVLQLVGPAGVVEEVGGDEGDVDVARLPDRLAVVDGLEHRELAGAFLDDARDTEEVFGPVGAAQAAPALLERAAGGAERRGDGGPGGPHHLGPG